jgi:hypothetical protein
MPAKTRGYSFIMRDGTVLSAHELARGIYLLMQDEPKLILDRIWKLIEAEIPTDRRSQFEVDFLEKMRLYSEAAALRVLITTKNNDKSYEPLLWEFEEYLFPSGPTDESQRRLEALKSAMGEIQTLSINPRPTWARDWFLQLGHDETDPSTLVAFIQMFAEATRGLRKLLNEAIPR